MVLNMKNKLEKLDCSRGAPMGRHNTFPKELFLNRSKYYLRRLKWVDSDYDEGGAYWGNTGKGNIYRAYMDGIEIFVRAVSRVEADRKVKKVLLDEIKRRINTNVVYNT